MPEAVIRERMEAEHARAKQQREKEVASNSDWFARSNAFDSFLAPPAPGESRPLFIITDESNPTFEFDDFCLYHYVLRVNHFLINN